MNYVAPQRPSGPAEHPSARSSAPSLRALAPIAARVRNGGPGSGGGLGPSALPGRGLAGRAPGERGAELRRGRAAPLNSAAVEQCPEPLNEELLGLDDAVSGQQATGSGSPHRGVSLLDLDAGLLDALLIGKAEHGGSFAAVQLPELHD